jgi:signal transduction histidine kinase
MAVMGADDCVAKNSPWRVLAAIARALRFVEESNHRRRLERRDRGVTRLLSVMQELSLACDVPTIQTIVQRAARDLTGAHGATFVLRDQDKCYYADEDAIAPLWKGQRFPLSACVSGWVMTNRKPALIPDIYDDPRVPLDAYRPTFVKSLVMVPIRTDAPIGAIGSYWAHTRRPNPDEVELLQALANTTAVAMENVGINSELENRVRSRTRLLEEMNRELEAFSYSVSHDLRAPLSAILGFAQLLQETAKDRTQPETVEYCDRIVQQTQRMNGLIRDLLRLSKTARAELKVEKVNVSTIAREAFDHLAAAEPNRQVALTLQDGLEAEGDLALVRIVLDNLISNAWKYSGKVASPEIEIGGREGEDGAKVFFVKDNGVGFDPRNATRLFAPFQRLHRQEEFPGVGVGLATVQRIIHKHGGSVWAESSAGRGATFYFTLPKPLTARVDSISEIRATRTPFTLPNMAVS